MMERPPPKIEKSEKPLSIEIIERLYCQEYPSFIAARDGIRKEITNRLDDRLFFIANLGAQLPIYSDRSDSRLPIYVGEIDIGHVNSHELPVLDEDLTVGLPVLESYEVNGYYDDLKSSSLLIKLAVASYEEKKFQPRIIFGNRDQMVEYATRSRGIPENKRGDSTYTPPQSYLLTHLSMYLPRPNQYEIVPLKAQQIYYYYSGLFENNNDN